MNFTVMNFFSLPYWSIWVHLWCTRVIVSSGIYMRKTIFILSNSSWCWNLSSWCIWKSGICSNLLLFTMSLEVISILLMFFLTMNFAIMNSSSLPDRFVWVHRWSTWVVVSSFDMWDTSIRYNHSIWSVSICHIHLHIFLIIKICTSKWLLEGKELLGVFYWFGFKGLKFVLKSLVIKLNLS